LEGLWNGKKGMERISPFFNMILIIDCRWYSKRTLWTVPTM
jgi:hypothetical protein